MFHGSNVNLGNHLSRRKNWEEAGEKPCYGFTEGSQFLAVGLLNISAEIDF